MKRFFQLNLIVLLLAVSVIGTSISGSVTSVANADDGDSYGACKELTAENYVYTEACDAEIRAHPMPPVEQAVTYVPERDGKAHPRSIYLPDEPYEYPIAWQKRAWYFSDAPGTLPADNDWTDARRIGKYTMYYIYHALEVDNAVWYLVGPNQWMKDEFVSVLQIPKRPEEVSGLWVAVDLTQQTLVAFEDDNPVYATLVSTGYWFPTPEGLFHVYARTLSTTLIGPPGADPPVYVLPATPWVLFYHEHRALHGAAFHNYLGMNRSHGSINLAPGDAEWVWNFFAQTEDEWDPTTDSYFVDNIDKAPWVYVYSSPKLPELPQW